MAGRDAMRSAAMHGTDLVAAWIAQVGKKELTRGTFAPAGRRQQQKHSGIALFFAARMVIASSRKRRRRR
jgi:hypothetical protein